MKISDKTGSQHSTIMEADIAYNVRTYPKNLSWKDKVSGILLLLDDTNKIRK